MSRSISSDFHSHLRRTALIFNRSKHVLCLLAILPSRVYLSGNSTDTSCVKHSLMDWLTNSTELSSASNHYVTSLRHPASVLMCSVISLYGWTYVDIGMNKHTPQFLCLLFSVDDCSRALVVCLSGVGYKTEWLQVCEDLRVSCRCVSCYEQLWSVCIELTSQIIELYMLWQLNLYLMTRFV